MCIVLFWILSLILEFIFSMLVIMFIEFIFGMLLYMFSMSNEHILVPLLIPMVFRSVIKRIELCMVGVDNFIVFFMFP
jgi:hypothetical protein